MSKSRIACEKGQIAWLSTAPIVNALAPLWVESETGDLDLMMPKMDGFQFLDEVRSRQDWRDISVVVITGKDLTDEDCDRLNGGLERIIQKSDRDEMLRQLTREISKRFERRAASGA